MLGPRSRPGPFAAAALLGALVGACATTPRPRGPLAVRNQHPAQILVLHMDPEGVRDLAAGDVRLRATSSYSSLFLGGGNGADAFQMDGEILRAGLGVAVGLGAGLELDAELPLLVAGGGFLDDFVVAWHDAFGFPDQGRDRAPKDAFSVRATRGGVVVHEMQPGRVELGDVPVRLTWNVLPRTDSRPFGLALRGAVELPTGDEDRGYGSGDLEGALGVVGELRHGVLAVTAHAQHTFAATPSRARRGGLTFADVSSFGLGVEVALTDAWSVLVQTEAETSTLRRLGFARAADVQWLLWTGARVRLSERLSFEAALGEDLSEFVAPDFTVHAAFELVL